MVISGPYLIFDKEALMKKKNKPQSSIGKYFAQLKEKEQETIKHNDVNASQTKKKRPKKQ